MAKPDQTYQEHIENVYQAWKVVMASSQGMLKRLSTLLKFDLDEFREKSLLTAVLHDIGKINEAFIEYMENVRMGKKFNSEKNYRHELLSLPFIQKATMSKGGTIPLFPFEALTIASHHKGLDSDFTSFDRERVKGNQPVCPDDGLAMAIRLAEDILRREGYQLPPLKPELSKYPAFTLLVKLISCIPLFMERYNPHTIRTLYILYKGILHYADWIGSSEDKLNQKIGITSQDVVNEIKKRCIKKDIPFKDIREFQKKVASTKGNLIAVAPTGSGKTEASIMWALNNMEHEDCNKILYLLPTMATANSIWDRLNKLFGTESTGLTHSSAQLMFTHEKNEADEEVTKEERKILFDRSFMRSVTVGTIDQLLNTGFHSKHWTVKEFSALNSVIILDEIHAYDGWTMGLIHSSIEHFSHLGVKFLFMSATMPPHLMNMLRKIIPDISIIQDEELLEETRSNYFVKDSFIEEDENAIRKAVEDGRKVLVVINTVDKCQQLAKQLQDLNPICYHSRFILKDRKKKEKLIEMLQKRDQDSNQKGGLVIATQVLEVALDIDFDWLFTECAPPDALAQRAGRVNRYRDPKRDSRIYIYKPSLQTEKLYNPLNDPHLLKRTYDSFREYQGRLKEKDLLAIIKKVYKEYDLYNSDAFKDAIEQYKESQRNRSYILDNRKENNDQEVTRKSKYETVTVIPYCFFDEIKKCEVSERIWYEVKVPYWYYRMNRKEDNGIPFCDMVYDSMLGGQLEPDRSTTML